MLRKFKHYRVLIELSFFIVAFITLNSHFVRSDSIDPAELNNEAIQAAQSGDFSSAVSKLEEAYQSKPNPQFATNLSKILSDWATQLYNQNKTELASEKLTQAVKYDSSNGPAWYFMGDIAYLKKSDFDGALKAWKKALETAPTSVRPSIVERISRAETDRGLERNFSAKESAHFTVRFSESVPAASVDEITSILENEYRVLATDLAVEPSRLTVIIYPKTSFDRLNSRFDWAIGFYDGRIRIRENDLGSELEKTILPHELAHAFLQNGFGANIPTWLHEGYAQTREMPRALSAEEKEILDGIKSKTRWIPLEWIDKRFTQPVDSEDVTRAYLESNFAVSYLLKHLGADQFRTFLKKISDGKPVQDAFDTTFKTVKWSSFSHGNFGESA